MRGSATMIATSLKRSGEMRLWWYTAGPNRNICVVELSAVSSFGSIPSILKHHIKYYEWSYIANYKRQADIE